MTKKPITLQDGFEAFMTVGVLGLSQTTVKWYERRLNKFMEFIDPERELQSIGLNDLLSYQASLERQDSLYAGPDSIRPEIEGSYSPEYLQGLIRAVKTFFKRLAEIGLIDSSPASGWKIPKRPKRTRKGITETNVRRILREAKRRAEEEAPFYWRDFALFYFLEATGCRREGLCRLTLSDLNLDHQDPRIRRRVIVREKGNKERTVFLHTGALEALNKWLEVRPKVPDDHVFIARKTGRAFYKILNPSWGEWGGLSPDGVTSLLRRYKEALKLSGSCSPHQWRHRWAKVRIQAGMDLSLVAQCMGHESVQVTEAYYAQFSVDELQAAFDRASEKIETDE